MSARGRHASVGMEEVMIRVSVMYPAKDGEAFDHAYYFDKHHKLCVSKLKPEGLVSCEFDKGVADGAGGKPSFTAVAHLVFNSVGDFQKAMGKHGKEILGDLPNYTTIQPTIQVNEIAAS
jgi:uncharacterized protein (TIGR02118 family)